MDDMTQSCVDIASLKTLYEKPKKKLIERKECNMMFTTSYYPERLSPDTCKYKIKFIPMYSTHKKY